MAKEKDDINNDESFEYRLKELSDEEIISILRYREQFKPQAVKDAIKEALKRGIINSVDDLNTEQFSPLPLQARSLFPLGVNKAYTYAIFKSLCRIFYAFGLIPIIYGVFKFLEAKFIFGLSGILMGLMVIYIVYKLEKQILILWANIIVLLNIPAVVMAFFFLKNKINLVAMDVFSIIVVVLILLYTSFYLKKLTAYFNTDSEQ